MAPRSSKHSRAGRNTRSVDLRRCLSRVAALTLSFRRFWMVHGENPSL